MANIHQTLLFKNSPRYVPRTVASEIQTGESTDICSTGKSCIYGREFKDLKGFKGRLFYVSKQQMSYH